jgi:hypothetical protein
VTNGPPSVKVVSVDCPETVYNTHPEPKIPPKLKYATKVSAGVVAHTMNGKKTEVTESAVKSTPVIPFVFVYWAQSFVELIKNAFWLVKEQRKGGLANGP